MEFNWFIALGLFFASSIVDALFALYTVAIVKTQPFKAASLSFIMYLLEAAGVLSYVDNKLYIIPLAFGAFVGSYVVVKREANKKKKPKNLKHS